MNNILKDQLIAAARGEYFNALDAKEPKAAGLAILTHDNKIIALSPLTLKSWQEVGSEAAITSKKTISLGEMLNIRLIENFKISSTQTAKPTESYIKAIALVRKANRSKLGYSVQYSETPEQLTAKIPGLVNPPSFPL